MLTKKHNPPWQQQKVWNTVGSFSFTFAGPLLKSTVMCVLFSSQILKRILALLKWLSKHRPLHCEAAESSHSVVIWLLLTEMRSQEKNPLYSRTVSFLNLTYNEMIKINAIVKKIKCSKKQDILYEIDSSKNDGFSEICPSRALVWKMVLC